MKISKKLLPSSLFVSAIVGLILTFGIFSCKTTPSKEAGAPLVPGFSFTGTVVEKTASGPGNAFNNGTYSIWKNGTPEPETNVILNPSGIFSKITNSINYRYLIKPNNLASRLPVIYEQLGSVPTSPNPIPYGYTFQLPILKTLPSQTTPEYLIDNMIDIKLKQKDNPGTPYSGTILFTTTTSSTPLTIPRRILQNTQYRIRVQGTTFNQIITTPVFANSKYSYEIEIFL